MRILIIVSLLFVPFVRADTATETTNVCHLERKNITCSRDSVIYIDSARFGRMKADICFSNIGHLNCSADVRLYLDRKCGGRRWCLLELDSVLDGSHHGCHADYRTYLKVTHHCLRVKTPRNGHSSQCPGDTYPVDMATSASGYLARVVTMETRIGSIDCPWSIQVRLGQTVRLTLYDFGIWQDPGAGNPAAGNNTCQVYATVTERSGSVGPRLICGRVTDLGRGQDRDRVVYTSNTNSVQVAVMTGKSSTLEQFLLKYEAVGCADPVPSPPNTNFERISDLLVIKCIKDNNEDPEQKTWTIQCLTDGNWSMSFHEINCSTASAVALESDSVEQKTVSYATFISVVIAGICIIIISNIIVATVVRRRCSNVASISDTKENMSYQELEMTRRQANPETSYMYIGVQPQPVYEEVIRH